MGHSAGGQLLCVVALDANTGETRWSAPTSLVAGLAPDPSGDGFVWAESDSAGLRVTAVDAAADARWSRMAIENTPLGQGHALALTAAGDRVGITGVFGTTSSASDRAFVITLDAATGADRTRLRLDSIDTAARRAIALSDPRTDPRRMSAPS